LLLLRLTVSLSLPSTKRVTLSITRCAFMAPSTSRERGERGQVIHIARFQFLEICNAPNA
ncbi:MAG: hypothetical protein ABL974_21575, partial [Prosthecobacter sp.]